MLQYRNLHRLQRISQSLRTFSTGDLPRVPEDVQRGSHYRSLCKLTLIGRTGAPPEVRQFDNGGKTLSLRVATTAVSGATQWHSVNVSENVPGFRFLQEMPTGTQVYIEGNMRVNTVTRDDGIEKTYINVNVYPGMGMLRVLGYPRRMEQADDLPF